MTSEQAERTLADFVFVGLNAQVLALDRYTGETIWSWKARKGSGFVSLLVDGDRLMVAVSGYVYCLDPVFGQEVWTNPLKGFGVGFTSIASINGGIPPDGAAAAAQQAAQAAATNPAVMG
jgi:outer membrane protein assembly factor BamB